MNHFLIAASLALALSKPAIANDYPLCNTDWWINNPVSGDEVIAAGLEPLLSQADRELRPDAASQYLYKWRMNALAVWVRCGRGSGEPEWNQVTAPGWAEGQLAKAPAAKADQDAQWAATQAAEAAKAAALKAALFKKGPLL
jgi:hypothetical protein